MAKMRRGIPNDTFDNDGYEENEYEKAQNLKCSDVIRKEIGDTEGRNQSNICSVWAVFLLKICEKFSFEGIKIVLILYFTQSLRMTYTTGKVRYHFINVVKNFTGIIGAIFADCIFGKFKTILGSLIIQCSGMILLVITSIQDIGEINNVAPLISLYVMSIGSGNLKVCLNAFGGDQMEGEDSKSLDTFFSLYYASLNVGKLLALIFIPLIRTGIHCYGGDCYPAVFGINLIIIMIAAIIFLMRTTRYTKKKPDTNIKKMVKIIFRALRNKLRSRGIVEKHWLHYADDKYDIADIDNVVGVLNTLVLFIPLPVFWALSSQQASTWTLQAEQMDGKIGSIIIKSDQMQILNTALILLLLPFFNNVIYPLCKKCSFQPALLKKMVCGMALIAVSFAISGYLQMKIQDVQSPPHTFPNASFFDIINISPCQLLQLHHESQVFLSLPYGSRSSYIDNIDFPAHEITATGTNCFSQNDTYSNELQLVRKNVTYQNLLVDINEYDMLETHAIEKRFLVKNFKKVETSLRIIYAPRYNLSSVVSIRFEDTSFKQKSVEISNCTGYNGTIQRMQPGEYILALRDQKGKYYLLKEINNLVKLRSYCEYTITVQRKIHHKFSHEIDFHIHADIKSPHLHRMWQVPQYIFMSSGTVMFGPVGMEFAYSQAPRSMKTILQSCWLLTIGFGNLIVVIISSMTLVNDIGHEMFLYSGFMILMSAIFSIMCHFYSYNYSEDRQVVITENITEDTV